MNTERRGSPRKPLKVAAVVQATGAPPIAGKTADVSLNGLSVVLSVDLPPGYTCLVNFDIPMKQWGKHHLSLKARVAYSVCGSEGFRIGMQFLDVDRDAETTIRTYTMG